jgi:ketosteroid isomerase-like protein
MAAEREAQGNVEVAERGFRALAEGGVEGLLPFVHPEFEVTVPPTLGAEPDTYRGHDGLRRYFDSFYEAMDEINFDPHEFIPVGERVVVHFTLRAKGRSTGIEADQTAYMVWELRDELAYRLELFTDLESAMATAEGR